MTKQQIQSRRNLYTQLMKLGIRADDVEFLIRIQRTLNRWAARECGTFYGRVEYIGGKPYFCNYVNDYPVRIRDMHAGAIRRLRRIMQQYPRLTCYTQSDPRGCALYIARKRDIRGEDQLLSIYRHGVAVVY